jgi:putative intracellular protease/amidase
VTASAVRSPSQGQAGGDGQQAAPARPLIVTGAIAASAATASGLAVIVVLVLIGWIAAPHAGLGLPSVLRTAAVLWLVGQHVGFTLRGTGPVGMLPLGLVLLPGALLWRAGRWVVSTGAVQRLRHVGSAALALALPYSLLTAVLALASHSAQISASVPEAALCGLLVGLCAGGLGAARALAPWPRLIQLLPARPRSVITAVAGAVGLLVAAGALLAGTALAMHLHEAGLLQDSLGAGWIGTVLLVLLQVGYVPNAVAWAISFTLGPGFSVGVGTIVAPTGASLGPLPAFPLLAALPPGVHPAMPAWLAPAVLALPYLAGGVGGWLLIKTAPTLSLEAAPLWGMVTGVLAGGLLGLLAAFSGGPLGTGRMSAVGPSGWQVAAVASLELGIGAAITAGVVNYFTLRRARPARGRAGLAGAALAGAALAGAALAEPPVRGAAMPDGPGRARLTDDTAHDSHTIYVNPWAGDAAVRPSPGPGPAALP